MPSSECQWSMVASVKHHSSSSDNGADSISSNIIAPLLEEYASGPTLKSAHKNQNIVPKIFWVIMLTVYRWCTVVSRHWNMMTLSWKCRTRAGRPCFICFVVWPTTSLKLKTVYRLLRRWQNVSEYRLPSKHAHRPNYCSWLAVRVN